MRARRPAARRRACASASAPTASTSSTRAARAAWQTVFHFHVHVIPRYDDDPLRLPWTPEPGDRDEIAAAGEGPRGLSAAARDLAVLAVARRARRGRARPRSRRSSRRSARTRQADGRGPLDIVRVAMSTRTDGSPARRADDARRPGTHGRPRAATGPSVSICLTLSRRRAGVAGRPSTSCARRRRSRGRASSLGRVLRDRANGLPREVGAATVTRPTARTVYLRFDPSAIRSPGELRFAAEAVRRGRALPAAARLPRHRAGRPGRPEI